MFIPSVITPFFLPSVITASVFPSMPASFMVLSVAIASVSKTFDYLLDFFHLIHKTIPTTTPTTTTTITTTIIAIVPPEISS